jgi:hypothetical protein
MTSQAGLGLLVVDQSKTLIWKDFDAVSLVTSAVRFDGMRE